MYPSWTQSALDDFKAAAFAKDDVGSRDANVVEVDLRVAVGCVVVAVDREDPLDGDAGEAGGNEDDGLLPVGVWVRGIAFTHDNVDFTSGVAGAAAPPFLGDCQLCFRYPPVQGHVPCH